MLATSSEELIILCQLFYKIERPAKIILKRHLNSILKEPWSLSFTKHGEGQLPPIPLHGHATGTNGTFKEKC